MRNFCFSTLLLLSIVAGAAILISCKGSQQLTAKISHLDLPTDSAVTSLLGDTLSRMLFSPSAVYAYKMRPQQADSDTLIGEHAIDHSIGELESSYYAILQFFLKDSANYDWSDDKVKTSFSPNIGFEFVGDNHEKAYLLLAFNGNQLEVVSQNKVILHRQFKNERYLLRFAEGLLPGNAYVNHLLNNPK